jgi:phage portal protein BeeE
MEWLERFKGVFKSHGLATVAGELNAVKLGESMKDHDMIQGRTFTRDTIREHFGVPREIMGITESSNRATSEAAQYIYAQNVLMPRLRMRQDAVNIQLVAMFGDGIEWRYDDIVPRNQEFDKQRALDAYNAGFITMNEARVLLDMPEVQNGNVFKTTAADIYIGEDEDRTQITASLSPDMGGLFGGMNDFDIVDIEGKSVKKN